MPKVKISGHYTLPVGTPNQKQSAAEHPHLSVESAGQSLITRVIASQENNVQLLGNRIKLSDLNFEEGSNMLWLEKTNVPYLEEKEMKANKWFNLYEDARDLTNIFKNLNGNPEKPEKSGYISDYPAASLATSRTLEFAVCIPMDDTQDNRMLYLHATQTTGGGTCTFVVHQCGTISDDNEQKYEMTQAIGTSDPMPVAKDLTPIEVVFDSAKVYAGEKED